MDYERAGPGQMHVNISHPFIIEELDNRTAKEAKRLFEVVSWLTEAILQGFKKKSYPLN